MSPEKRNRRNTRYINKNTSTVGLIIGLGPYWILNKDVHQFLGFYNLILMEHIFQLDRACFLRGIKRREDYNDTVYYNCRNKSIMKWTGDSEDTIQRYQVQLELLGLLKYEGRANNVMGRPATFSINIDNLKLCFTDPEKYFATNNRWQHLLPKMRRNFKRIQALDEAKYTAPCPVRTPQPEVSYNKVSKNPAPAGTGIDQRSIYEPPVPKQSDLPSEQTGNVAVSDAIAMLKGHIDPTLYAELLNNIEKNKDDAAHTDDAINTISNVASNSTAAKEIKTNTASTELAFPDPIIQPIPPPPVSKVNRKIFKDAKEGKKQKPSRTALKRTLLPETVELLEYWNSKGNLKNHNLIPSPRGSYRYASQLKYVQKADDYLKHVLDGTFYKDFSDLDMPNMKSVKYQPYMIKQAIDRFSKIATFEYSEKPDRFKSLYFCDFLHNPAAVVFKAKKGNKPSPSRFLFKYAFIHCMMKEPQPLSERAAYIPEPKNPIIVSRVLKILKDHDGYTQNNQNYGIVVRHVDKAIDIVKASANGSSQRIIDMLPNFLMKCMGNKVHVDSLYTAVEFKLLPYLRQIREISS